MSTPAVDYDALAQQAGATNASAQPAQPQSQNGVDYDALAAQSGALPSEQTESETDPKKTGEITNDVGNKVIVPKDGEDFADTMKRAVAHYQSMTPEQRQSAINKETATIPGKAATVIGAAPVIGAGGAAALAAPGEVVQAVRAIPGITETLLQHAESKAAEWAAQYPHLISLAGKLGIPTSTAAVLGWLYHNSKK
jgi:hypothetical protein